MTATPRLYEKLVLPAKSTSQDIPGSKTYKLSIIWDVLFEPLTEELRNLIRQNVEEIINYDPRIRAEQVIVTQYESGIQIECRLVYLPYYIQEAIQLRFDQQNGIVV